MLFHCIVSFSWPSIDRQQEKGVNVKWPVLIELNSTLHCVCSSFKLLLYVQSITFLCKVKSIDVHFIPMPKFLHSLLLHPLSFWTFTFFSVFLSLSSSWSDLLSYFCICVLFEQNINVNISFLLTCILLKCIITKLLCYDNFKSKFISKDKRCK